MTRKRLTQVAPWLLPIRKKQRCFCFYAGMFFDKNHYANKITEQRLPNLRFEGKSKLINENTGFDIQYQRNKVYNLKLAAKTLNGLIVEPGETFSFWKKVRYAEKYEKYKAGLTAVDGEIKGVSGGGLCQLSNLLYWLFLHTPLEITERHPHRKQHFSIVEEEGEVPQTADATVSEGWLDLKAKNNTQERFQIEISLDEEFIFGRIYSE